MGEIEFASIYSRLREEPSRVAATSLATEKAAPGETSDITISERSITSPSESTTLSPLS